MSKRTTSHQPELSIRVADGPEAGHLFTKVDWMAFVNGGFVLRVEFRDSYWELLRDLITRGYLRNGRRAPTPVQFELKWRGEKETTGVHFGYLSDVDASGVNISGSFTVVVVDPPTWWLNAGDCSGDVYQGKVSGVMKQVLQKYFQDPNGGGEVRVSETDDSDQNQWWQMRQDPKTFLGSLIDWSSSVTRQRTQYIVSSDGDLDTRGAIHVMEQAARKPEFYRSYVFNSAAPSANDGTTFQFLADPYISAFQKQLITHGLSSVSERYFDRVQDRPRKVVHVYDERTSAKWNVELDQERGFTKPSAPSGVVGPTRTNPVEKPHEWSTSIASIPQHNAGDVGIGYDKYIDGRARTRFLDMLKHVMRLKLTILGDPSKKLADTHNLGVSYLKLTWTETGSKDMFLSGNWMVYGFHHRVSTHRWLTDLYCNRLDWNAEAKKIPEPKGK